MTAVSRQLPSRGVFLAALAAGRVSGDPPAVPAPACWPFDEGHPFFIILNLALGGRVDEPHLPPDETAPQRLYVDYVRVYQPAASG